MNRRVGCERKMTTVSMKGSSRKLQIATTASWLGRFTSMQLHRSWYRNTKLDYEHNNMKILLYHFYGLVLPCLISAIVRVIGWALVEAGKELPMRTTKLRLSCQYQ